MARPVLVAAAVVLVVAAGAAPAQPLEAAAVGELSILSLDGTVEHGTAEQSLDVGTAVALDRDATARRLDRYVLAERFRRADSTTARRAIVGEALSAVANRSAALRADERATRRAYANGSIDAATAARRLALLSARADRLQADVGHLRTLGDRVSATWFEERVAALEAGLLGFRIATDTSVLGLQGPVRARALAAIRGGAPALRLYVAASADGAVLAMLDDAAGRYVREAYREDRWTIEGTDTMDPGEVVQLAEDRYPIAADASRGGRYQGFLGRSVYRVEFTLSGGSLTFYLDADTRSVFHEVRDQPTGGLASPDAVTRVANGTRLVVNRTYRGGPLRVAVYDNATGEPIPATVVVGGTRMATGADGTRWTVAPGSDRFLVIAVTPDGRVSAFVRPIEPPAVG